MTDNHRLDDADQDYFDKLTAKMSAHPDWRFTDPTDEISSEAASGFYEGEIKHNQTDGILQIQVPREDGQDALSGYLRNTILSEPYHNQEPSDDSLHFSLEEVYHQIATDHTSEYVRPVTISPDQIQFDISQLAIPWEYDEAAVNEAMDVLSEAAQEAYNLNQDVRSPVEQYLNK